MMMNNRTMGTAMTGLALGLAAGTAVYAAGNMSTHSKRRKMKKNADKAMKNVSSMIDSVAYMVR